jgi:uncharacterized membrane-anchored protein
VSDRPILARLTARGALRVPQITVWFWVIKALSTAMGEATSDSLVEKLHPVPAVLLGFTGWYKTEKTLSIHTVDTVRREIFYWLAVLATFAMGTALGDLTATTFHLGYLASGIMFAVVICIPALGYRLLHWDGILCFWFAYVATRPLGASFADWMGKPRFSGGLGWGDPNVAMVLTLIIFVLVAFLAMTRIDLQRDPGVPAGRPGVPGPGAAGGPVPAAVPPDGPLTRSGRGPGCASPD